MICGKFQPELPPIRIGSIWRGSWMAVHPDKNENQDGPKQNLSTAEVGFVGTNSKSLLAKPELIGKTSGFGSKGPGNLLLQPEPTANLYQLRLE